MLAVDSRMYKVPERIGTGWRLESLGDSKDVILVDRFKWTLVEGHRLETSWGDEIEGRATFEYDCNSVKPSVRTLRVYGADYLRPIISYLSSRKFSAPMEEGKSDGVENGKSQISAISEFFGL
jgi:hypothetical protein